ncbi:polycystin-1-like protein 2 [Lampetra planeri]
MNDAQQSCIFMFTSKTYFTGIDNYQDPKTTLFTNPLQCTGIRIKPTNWQSDIALRVEVLSRTSRANATKMTCVASNMNTIATLMAENVYMGFACYLWDLGDGHTVAYGAEFCKRLWPNVATVNEYASDTLTFSYTYSSFGKYSIQLQEITGFSRSSYNTTLYLNSYGCTPYTLIIGGETANKPKTQFLKVPEQLDVMATLNMSCLLKYENIQYIWSITNQQNGNIRAINANNNSLQHFDPFYFTQGTFLIQVTVNLQPLGLQNLLDNMTLIVDATPLQMQITGGDTRTVGNGADVQIDASLSYDPDDPSQSNSGITFKWRCTKVSYDNKLTICTYVDLGAGIISIPQSELQTNSVLQVEVTATKNIRVANKTQVIHVIEGNPLDIYISGWTSESESRQQLTYTFKAVLNHTEFLLSSSQLSQTPSLLLPVGDLDTQGTLDLRASVCNSAAACASAPIHVLAVDDTVLHNLLVPVVLVDGDLINNLINSDKAPTPIISWKRAMIMSNGTRFLMASSPMSNIERHLVGEAWCVGSLLASLAISASRRIVSSMDFDAPDLVSIQCTVTIQNPFRLRFDHSSMVHPNSTMDSTVCVVGGGHKATTTNAGRERVFVAAEVLAPNTIDFSTVFTKFDLVSNGAVFAAVIVIILLYVIMLLWARKADIKDNKKNRMFFLFDVDDENQCLLVLRVATAKRQDAGTRCGVCFTLYFKEFDTGIRELAHPEIKEFKRDSIYNFLFSVPKNYGYPLDVKLWLKDADSFDCLFVSEISVLDLEKQQVHFFCVNSMESSDTIIGHYGKIFQVKNDHFSFNNSWMVHEALKGNFSEGHLWFSVFFRPFKTNFSRVQRISCCVTLLFLMMIANAMWFGKKQAANEAGGGVTVGPLSLTDILISLLSSLVEVPVSLVVVLIFRNSRSESERPPGQKSSWRGPWPGGCRFVGWCLIVLTVLSSGFFTILYSMEWGSEKANRWLVRFLFSFVLSVILIQPMKNIVFAVGRVLMWKKNEKYQADEILKPYTESYEIMDSAGKEKLQTSNVQGKEIAIFVTCSWERVTDAQSYWDWVSNSLLPYMKQTGSSATTSEAPGNEMNRFHLCIVGLVRLQQLRYTKGSSKLNFVAMLKNGQYTPPEEDTNNYSKAWVMSNSTGGTERDQYWIFKDMGEEIISMNGERQGRGGYLVEAANDAVKAADTVAYLRENSWVDPRTAALVTEVSVLNANTKLLCHLTLLLIFSSPGVAKPQVNARVFSILEIGELQFNLNLTAYVSIFVLNLLLLACDVPKICKEKGAYFKKVTHLVEFLCFGLRITTAVAYYQQTMTLKETLETYTQDGNVTFGKLASLDERLRVALALLVFVESLKALQLPLLHRGARRCLTLPLLHREAGVKSRLLMVALLLTLLLCAYSLSLHGLYGAHSWAHAFQSVTSALVRMSHLGEALGGGGPCATLAYLSFRLMAFLLLYLLSK